MTIKTKLPKHSQYGYHFVDLIELIPNMYILTGID